MIKCPECFRTFMIGDEVEQHRRFEDHLPYCDGKVVKIKKEGRKNVGSSRKKKTKFAIGIITFTKKVEPPGRGIIKRTDFAGQKVYNE